ncbi:hypothetical protein [Nesterenkonia flava]|uniref:Uncharacterized protein n=1 Tax=Nesterenkonia flava TaxID=469799 RepID=A0ABU1FWC9_9MICC|nr:hypothetical protein [Nesterenkonia flava]MDR5712785.1 hypothetical protein [Nesterenkonia flava]
MILKIAFAVITILSAIAGIIALTGDNPEVASGFAFGAAVLSAIGVAYLIGRDGKKNV